MQRRVVTNGLVMLGLLLAMAYINPGADGVHPLHASETFLTEPDHIWLWDQAWAGSAYVEVPAGSSVTWGFGWGSGSRDALEETLYDLQMEFRIDGREVNSPKRYFSFQDMGTRTDSYWVLVFLYRDRPLPPGEYFWSVSLSGSVPEVVATGVLVVKPR